MSTYHFRRLTGPQEARLGVLDDVRSSTDKGYVIALLFVSTILFDSVWELRRSFSLLNHRAMHGRVADANLSL